MKIKTGCGGNSKKTHVSFKVVQSHVIVAFLKFEMIIQSVSGHCFNSFVKTQNRLKSKDVNILISLVFVHV